MSSTAVVTDSTCDIPERLVEKYQLEILPLYINYLEESYRDGVDMSRQEYYQLLRGTEEIPTTASPGPSQFRRVYERLGEEGADQIISIHISPSLSSTYEMAVMGARETTSVDVTVVDSQQLSMGTGFMVIEAARLAREGRNSEEILAHIDSMIPRAHVFAALESMTYLMRSGRINTIVGSVGNILDIRPILKMNRGEPTSERVRTERLASARLLELLEEVSPVEQFAVVHTDAPEKAQRFLEKARPYIGTDRSVESAAVTPVIGSHIGPGSFGFACLSREAETTD